MESDIAGKEPTISAGTTSQYRRGDKSWQTLDKTAVGLGNVDNTSDSTKNSAVVTLTNKTIDLTSNTLTGTKAQFDSACSDGNFLYVGDVTQYTDELAQDAAGNILTDTNTINFTYDDASPTITADLRTQNTTTVTLSADGS